MTSITFLVESFYFTTFLPCSVADHCTCEFFCRQVISLKNISELIKQKFSYQCAKSLMTCAGSRRENPRAHARACVNSQWEVYLCVPAAAEWRALLLLLLPATVTGSSGSREKPVARPQSLKASDARSRNARKHSALFGFPEGRRRVTSVFHL